GSRESSGRRKRKWERATVGGLQRERKRTGARRDSAGSFGSNVHAAGVEDLSLKRSFHQRLEDKIAALRRSDLEAARRLSTSSRAGTADLKSGCVVSRAKRGKRKSRAGDRRRQDKGTCDACESILGGHLTFGRGHREPNGAVAHADSIGHANRHQRSRLSPR